MSPRHPHRFLRVLLMAGMLASCAASQAADPAAELFYQAMALRQQGDLNGAIAKLEASDRLAPDVPAVVFNLALFTGEAQDIAKSVVYWERLVALEPDNTAARGSLVMYRAILLAHQGDSAGAIARLESLLAREPDNAGLIWNTATLMSDAGQHDYALTLWRRMAELEPDNLHLRSKIVQSLQAGGDRAGRDAAIDELLRRYRAGADPEYAKGGSFCREQYRVGDHRVFAFQHFEPRDPRRIFYSFVVTAADGSEAFRVTLGSYQATTEMARSTGSIGPDARLYHIDLYQQDRQTLIDMLDRMPDYDALRERADRAIRARLAAAS